MRTKSSGDIVFAWFVYAFLLLVFIATFYPFWNILVLSLNSAEDTIRGGVYFWPRVFSLTSYAQILGDQEIINGVKVTLARTLIGTPLAVL
ncbi:carbohydrate ABC transporter permease, partial [Paenibacillus sp. TAF58]